ncbi:MAG: hypothetical protein AAFX06_28345, partial [Planctomycetota bacterium]
IARQSLKVGLVATCKNDPTELASPMPRSDYQVFETTKVVHSPDLRVLRGSPALIVLPSSSCQHRLANIVLPRS